MGALGVKWRGMVGIAWGCVCRNACKRRMQESACGTEGWHKRGSVSPTNLTGGSFPSLNQPNE